MEPAHWSFIVAVILAVAAVSAFLAFMAWKLFKSAERAERDPRYLRRRLLSFGLLYAFGAVYGITELITGKEKVPTLVGLAMGATLAWLYLKAAASVKVPPSK
jgi:threonine/homoserine/homoserine lactone efflux protein